MYQLKFHWVMLFWSLGVTKSRKESKSFQLLIHNFHHVGIVFGRNLLRDFTLWKNKWTRKLEGEVIQTTSRVGCYSFLDSNARGFKVKFEERIISQSPRVKDKTCFYCGD